MTFKFHTRSISGFRPDLTFPLARQSGSAVRFDFAKWGIREGCLPGAGLTVIFEYVFLIYEFVCKLIVIIIYQYLFIIFNVYYIINFEVAQKLI